MMTRMGRTMQVRTESIRVGWKAEGVMKTKKPTERGANYAA
jgi:hypothetical protein